MPQALLNKSIRRKSSKCTENSIIKFNKEVIKLRETNEATTSTDKVANKRRVGRRKKQL